MRTFLLTVIGILIAAPFIFATITYWTATIQGQRQDARDQAVDAAEVTHGERF